MSDTRNNNNINNKTTVNLGYLMGLVTRAFELSRREQQEEQPHLQTAQERQETERRLQKAVQIQGMIQDSFTGKLDFGSRRPLKDYPAWVTPKVSWGGFATGQLEASLITSTRIDGNTAKKRHTNEEFLTPEGLKQLTSMLSQGNYRIKAPEHAALLCVAWLLEQGHYTEVQSILEAILPYFSQIQFFPEFADTPLEVTSQTCLWTLEEVKQELTKRYEIWKNPAHGRRIRMMLAQKNALQVWLPFKLRLLRLWEQTVMNDWPCQVYPEGWEQQAADMLMEYYGILGSSGHPTILNTRKRRRGNMARLISCLQTRVIEGSQALTGRQVSWIRQALMNCQPKYGGEELMTTISAEEHLAKLQEAAPAVNLWYDPVMEQLQQYQSESGLPRKEIENVLNLQGIIIPESIKKILRRALLGTVEDLLEAGLVKSGEVLATLIPVVVAESTCAQIENEDLKRLYYALSLAFEKRRSLLLLNLESQVKLDELPWAKPILARRTFDAPAVYRDALVRLVSLQLHSFPHTIFPNKLLRSLRRLVEAGQMQLPLVDELAADIFENRLTQKFADAADIAASLMINSPYACYYDLRYFYGSIDESSFTPEMLVDECQKRVSADGSLQAFVVQNGRIIEWVQIATTHNLASLVYTLDLRLKVEWPLLVVKTWEWIVHQVSKTSSLLPRSPKAHLHSKKNIGYAWRQLLFYVSMTQGDPTVLLESLRSETEQMNVRQRTRALLESQFLSQLEAALKGESPEQIVLGWQPTNPPFQAKKPEQLPAFAKKTRYHNNVCCDMCHPNAPHHERWANPIENTRFRATNVPNFNLCEKCMKSFQGLPVEYEETEFSCNSCREPIVGVYHRATNVPNYNVCRECLPKCQLYEVQFEAIE